MKQLLLGMATCLLMVSCASSPQATMESPVASLGWLVGTWRTDGDQRYTIESWQWAEDGGSLIGDSKTMRDGKQVFSESLVIEHRADGVYYAASPQGQATNAFRMVESSSTRAVFEDMEHDFPYRITYTMEAPDTLAAQIFGKQNGKERSASWRYTRMPIY